MIESRVLEPKTGPERRAGYQTNFPPTTYGVHQSPMSRLGIFFSLPSSAFSLVLVLYTTSRGKEDMGDSGVHAGGVNDLKSCKEP